MDAFAKALRAHRETMDFTGMPNPFQIDGILYEPAEFKV